MTHNELLLTLPDDPGISIATLSSVFRHTTNAYKYLWFLAVLECSRRHNHKKTRLSNEELFNEMLIKALIPSQHFRLSFGPSDKISYLLSNIISENDTTISEHSIRNILVEKCFTNEHSDLLRYVRYRLLTPWFSSYLNKSPDQQKNQIIKDLSISEFESLKPLYLIENTHIEIHEKWLEYFQKNHTIIKGWVTLNWLNFLQSKNPSVPNIINKLGIPETRGRLTESRKWWSNIISSKNIKCIYSGIILDDNNFSLDHFIPWTYVAHDEPWNLIPVAIKPNVNSMKGNRLPSHDYLEPFLNLQSDFIDYYKSNNKIRYSYITGLRIDEESINNPEVIKNRLSLEIKNLHSGASGLGFISDWKCQLFSPS